jgi:hypothetical protein
VTEQNKRSLSVSKRAVVFSILGLILILAGSVFGIDWMNYFQGAKSLYPAIGKPIITLLAMVIVLITGSDRISDKDYGLLFAAFCCMLPTDILMSMVVISPSLSVGSWVFMLGGILSILAHIFLIIRISRGLPYLKKGAGGISRFWLPLAIYGSAVVVLLTLWTDIVRVGHAAIAPVYTAFFCTTMWFAWETMRNKLYPRINAWMVSIAATCWYLTEISGEIYNLGLGNISEIMFRLVWVFYGTNVVLWALSGYKWNKE